MSKNTLYFNTVEEANQYFPDGVPSNVLAIVGDGSQVLVSSDNAAGNVTQQYFNADLTNDEIVNTMVQTSYNQGFSYGESVTYPIAYEAGYSYGYDIGEIAGYDTGYAAGQAEGGANWIDVLYLDEKAKAESFLEISSWGLSDFYKYNFAKYDTSTIFIDQQSALAFISGLQTNSTMWKLIKISKDANDNAVITYNPCSINFDGTNVGAIALDGVTYYSKICIWGTLTLAVGDEVIMSCATDVPNTITIGLFGGFDSETNDPATYKCTTAGTYTFGLWVDAPTVQNGEAACFVSTMFDYEGSATVPAITVPTGEPTSGITSNDFLGQIVNNTITAGHGSFVISDQLPDSSVLTDAYQAGSNGLGVVYKASGDTLSTLPLYTPYDEETGSQSELVYNDGVDENSYYDWMASAPISLQVGDMLGFVVGSEYNALWIAPFDGSEPFVCETAGNYTVLMSSYTDDESGEIVWDFHIVPSTQLSGDYSNITNLNEMTAPINSGE